MLNILKEKSLLIDKVNGMIDQSKASSRTVENELVKKIRAIVQLPENLSPQSIESVYASRSPRISKNIRSGRELIENSNVVENIKTMTDVGVDTVMKPIKNATEAIENSDMPEDIQNVVNSTMHTVIDNIENVTEIISKPSEALSIYAFISIIFIFGLIVLLAVLFCNLKTKRERKMDSRELITTEPLTANE